MTFPRSICETGSVNTGTGEATNTQILPLTPLAKTCAQIT